MVAAAVIGGAAIGAISQSSAANKAADAQTRAAQQASDTQMAMYNQTRADQAPWRAAGGNALDALSRFYGLPGADGTTQTPDYNKILSGLPGYQFQMQEGNKAVQQNLAAKGMLQSGAAGKALTQYGQGLAANYADRYVGGLQSLAGLGISANQTTATAGANAAQGAANAGLYGGAAQASGYVASGNAWANAANSMAGAYGNYMRGPQGGLNYYTPQSQYQLSPVYPSSEYQLAPIDKSSLQSQYVGLN